MPSSYLLKNLVLFGRLLRSVGLDVGSSQVIDLAAALEYVDIGKRADFYFAARALCAHSHADLALFDQAFNLFWQPRTLPPLDIPSMPHPGLQPKSLRLPGASYRELSAGETIQPVRDSGRLIVELQRTYSSVEVLRKKNFEAFTWEEVQQAKQLMAEMTWRVGRRRTRRKMPVGYRARLDMRRVIRQNLKHGGELVALAWKDTRLKPRPLVVLCDISGSMERYSRMLLHFIHTLSNGLDRVEAFLFGTRLTRITRQLAHKDIDEAINEVVRVVEDWGGGTRIGEAIKTFNYQWARRIAARGAVVLIISDGWDRGDADLLSTEIARLQRSCFRLIWLNPLLGLPDYEPLTRGLQAALPHVDDFLSVHNLESLDALGRALANLDTARPARQQRGVPLQTDSPSHT